MAMRIRCADDLHVKGCDFVVHGEGPVELVEKVVEHLQEDHDIEMPDAETIVTGDLDEPTLDPNVRIIIRRLRAALDIPGEE